MICRAGDMILLVCAYMTSFVTLVLCELFEMYEK